MLANLLPGLREIRAPLISGYLWLIFFFLLLRNELPSQSHPGATLEPIFDLAEGLSTLGLATAASVAAYLIGSSMQEMLKLAGRVVSPQRPLYGEAGTHLSKAGRRDIHGFVEMRVQNVRRRLFHVALSPGEKGVDQEPTRWTIERELPLIRTLMLGERPELVGELDRLQAEADLRITVAAPLVAFGVFLALEASPGWLALLIPAILLGAQGFQRQLEAGDLLAKALRIGRANAPALESLEASAEAALERTALEEELEEELKGKGAEGNPRSAFRLGNVLATGGNYETALTWLRFAADKGVIQAHAELGFVCERLDDLPGAESAYRNGDERNDPKARRLLAELLSRMDRADEALHTVRREASEDEGVSEARIKERAPGERGRIAGYRQRLESGDPVAALNLGLLLERRGDLAGAASAFRQAIAFGDADNPRTWRLLGRVETERGRATDAEAALRQSLSIGEAQSGKDHFGLAGTLEDLGYGLRLEGRFSEGVSHLERALELRERELGPRHLDVAKTLDSLGVSLRGLGRYQAALATNLRGLEIKEELLGRRDPETALSLGVVGSAYRLLGDYENAVRVQREALDLKTELLGPGHVEVMKTMSNLGNALLDSGDAAAALKMQRDAMEIQEAEGGDRAASLDLAIGLHGLGEALLATGDLTEAEKALTKALVVIGECPSPNPPVEADILLILAKAERRLGRPQDALARVEKAIELQAGSLGRSHPELVNALLLSAEILDTLNQAEPAEDARARASAIEREREGEG